MSRHAVNFVAVWLVLAAVAALPASAERVVEAEPPGPAQASGVEARRPTFEVDTTKLDTRAWKHAIERLTSVPAVQQGATSVTLLRVLLEGSEAPLQQQPTDAEQPTVNGVELFIAGASVKAAQPERKVVNVQLTSTKLNTLDSFPGGGGMYRNAGHGDFILVEHINSTRRRGGRDPVQVRSFTHHHADLWVTVPPRGQVGVLGDVVLKRATPSELGRIVADVRGRPTAQNLQVGAITVGGPYGRSYKLSEGGLGGTDLLAPGVYNVLLPDFDRSKSRWEVVVPPGGVAYLLFAAQSTSQVNLIQKQNITLTLDPGSPVARPR